MRQWGSIRGLCNLGMKNKIIFLKKKFKFYKFFLPIENPAWLELSLSWWLSPNLLSTANSLMPIFNSWQTRTDSLVTKISSYVQKKREKDLSVIFLKPQKNEEIPFMISKCFLNYLFMTVESHAYVVLKRGQN
jgi:hypothetical protein